MLLRRTTSVLSAPMRIDATTCDNRMAVGRLPLADASRACVDTRVDEPGSPRKRKTAIMMTLMIEAARPNVKMIALMAVSKCL